MMTYSEAGKGSAPRKVRDDAAYASGWERIFGNKMNIDLNTLEITTSADSVHAFIDAIKPKFNIRLCGSRYFAQRDEFIRLNIDEFTDYDYFCQTNDELKQILTQKVGYKQIIGLVTWTICASLFGTTIPRQNKNFRL